MNEAQSSQFSADLQAIMASVRSEVEKGVVESQAIESREAIVTLLNHSLATEILCVHRYKNHYYVTMALGEQLLANEFLEHANEEQGHADQLAKRIAELGGMPEYDPAIITKTAHSAYKPCATIEGMLAENLIAERTAVAIYRKMIQFIENKDPVTRRLLEEILAVEEEHVDDLQDFVNKYGLKN